MNRKQREDQWLNGWASYCLFGSSAFLAPPSSLRLRCNTASFTFTPSVCQPPTISVIGLISLTSISHLHRLGGHLSPCRTHPVHRSSSPSGKRRRPRNHLRDSLLHLLRQQRPPNASSRSRSPVGRHQKRLLRMTNLRKRRRLRRSVQQRDPRCRNLPPRSRQPNPLGLNA